MMAKWRMAFRMGQPEVIAFADKINYLGNTTAASSPLRITPARAGNTLF